MNLSPAKRSICEAETESYTHSSPRIREVLVKSFAWISRSVFTSKRLVVATSSCTACENGGVVNEQ